VDLTAANQRAPWRLPVPRRPPGEAVFGHPGRGAPVPLPGAPDRAIAAVPHRRGRLPLKSRSVTGMVQIGFVHGRVAGGVPWGGSRQWAHTRPGGTFSLRRWGRQAPSCQLAAACRRPAQVCAVAAAAAARRPARPSAGGSCSGVGWGLWNRGDWGRTKRARGQQGGSGEGTDHQAAPQMGALGQMAKHRMTRDGNPGRAQPALYLFRWVRARGCRCAALSAQPCGGAHRAGLGLCAGRGVRGAACGARRAGRGVRGAACEARRAGRGAVARGLVQGRAQRLPGQRRRRRAREMCGQAGRTRRTRFWAQPWLERSNRVCVLLYIHPRPVGGGRGRRPSSSAGCRSRKWAGAPCWRPRRAPDISSSMRGAYLTPRRTGGARRRAARARETAEGGRSRAKPKQAKMPRRPLLVTPALCARQQAQVARGAGATSIDEGGRRGPRVI
jgi:hypothetical protein